MAETKKPDLLLDLNTLIERPKIRIDGKDYEILSPDELSILDSQRLSTWGHRLTELSKQHDISDEMDVLVGEIAAKILQHVPGSIIAKLSGLHKLQIVSAFTGLLLARTMGTAGAMARTIQSAAAPVQAQTQTGKKPRSNPLSIGVKSSPASSASMAGRPAGGSKKRRPRS